MTRRSFLGSAAATAATGGALLAAPAAFAQAPSIRWRMASSFPKSLDALYGTGEAFAHKVSEMTGGRFQVSSHAAGEIVPAFGVVDALQADTIEIAHSVPYYFYGKNPAFAIGSAIPFGLNSRQMDAWMNYGNGRKLMDELYGNYGMLSFACGNTGAQMGGWFRKEIKGVDDLKGLKFRLGGGLVGAVMTKLGVVPQSTPGGELYQALEKGTIDAVEFVGPYDDQKLGFNKIAPFYYYPGWWEGGPEVNVFINKKAFAALPAEYRAIVECAAAFAHRDMLSKYDARNPIALKQLVGSGTKVLPFPKAMLDASYKATMETYAELDSKSPEWKKIYADLREFQRDQIMWFRLNEGRFDSYMHTLKV